MPRKGAGKKKQPKKLPPLATLVHKLYDSSQLVNDHDVGMIQLEENLSGKGRGFIARAPIPAGRIIHRSAGYLCSPYQPPPDYLNTIPEEKKLSVHLLGQILEQLEDKSYPTPHLHRLMNHVVMKELQPQKLNEWEGKQTKESQRIAELFCMATKRPLSQIDEISRIALISVVNSHQVTYDFAQAASQDWGIFPSASFFNHSCWPNCTAFYSKKHKEFWIRSMEDIATGEELTISYVDIYLTRFERMGKLQLQYEFHCRCEKCLRGEAYAALNRIDCDLEGFRCPTEGCNGSYARDYSGADITASGLRCRKCNKQEEGDIALDQYNAFEQQMIEGLHNLSLCFGEPSIQDFNVKYKEVETMAKENLFLFNSYFFRLKMARARFDKLMCQQADEANVKRLNECLITSLTEVNTMCVIIYPRFHPQRAHILLDLGVASTNMNRPALGRKYIAQAKKILQICRGDDVWKRMVSYD